MKQKLNSAFNCPEAVTSRAKLAVLRSGELSQRSRGRAGTDAEETHFKAGASPPPAAKAVGLSSLSSYHTRLSNCIESVSALPTALIKAGYKSCPLPFFVFEDSAFLLPDPDTSVFEFKPKYL